MKKALAILLTVLFAIFGTAGLFPVFFAAYSIGFAAVVFAANALLNWLGGVHFLGFYKTLAVGALCNVVRIGAKFLGVTR